MSPEGALLQGRELVEEGRNCNRVYCHKEDLQPKDEAPQIQRHVRASVLEDPCEGCNDWRHQGYAQCYLQGESAHLAACDG